MEKLIELLNEWVNHMMPGGAEYYSKGNSIYLKFKAPLSGEGKIEDEVICSKRYGFIERLVKNDKIDQFYYENSVRVKRYIDDYEEYDYVFPMDYEQLIMLLSIEDNPIEWLCEILK